MLYLTVELCRYYKMYSNFTTFDYILFCLSLCIPMSISLYVGCFKNKQKSAKEYLYGKNNLNALSVGLSLYSGTVSSLSILGTASEVYIFGTQFLAVTLGSLASSVAVWYFVLPVFCGNLNLKTPYEYFELRFDKQIRMLMSTLILIHSITFMSAVLFASTVSFSQYTEISLVLCTTVVGAICTIYTLIGGFVGVIWTDVIQASLMLFSCIFVMIKGVNMSGGIAKVWTIAEEGQRIQFFNFDLNPFVRLTFWSAFLGMCALNMAFGGCSAKALQRFMAVNGEKAARTTTIVSTVGYTLIISISGVTGLSIYALYRHCDPISSKTISSPTQLLPYFINDIAGYLPGFVGFFTAGLLSAGLSSISADMNVISGLIYYDFLQKIFKTSEWKLKDTVVMKLIVLLYGIVLVIVAPIVARYKYILQVALSAGSLSYGPVVAVTVLGTTFPKVNAKGTLWGVISSLICMAWISFNALNLDLSSQYALPVSTENCTFSTNYTLRTSSSSVERSTVEEPFILFKLSYMYYTFFGMVVTIFVAVIISYFTGGSKVSEIRSDLIIPGLRKVNRNVELDEMLEYETK